MVAPWGRQVGTGLTSLCALETPPYLAHSSLCQSKVPSPIPTVCCVSNQKLLPHAGRPLCLPQPAPLAALQLPAELWRPLLRPRRTGLSM